MTANSVTKTCAKCGLNLPASDFSKDKNRRDGLQSQCKGCFRAYTKANRERIAAQKKVYNAANRERIAEQTKAYREANREQIAEQKKARYEANREEILTRDKAWREANREKRAEYQKAYQQANREKLAEQEKVYREANREKIAKRMKAYFKANPDIYRAHKQNRRARQRNAEGTHTSEQVQARFAVHGSVCIYCSSTEALHADHIKPLKKGGSNWASNLAPACATCNRSKGPKWGADLLRWLEQNCTVARTSRILTAILT